MRSFGPSGATQLTTYAILLVFSAIDDIWITFSFMNNVAVSNCVQSFCGYAFTFGGYIPQRVELVSSS